MSNASKEKGDRSEHGRGAGGDRVGSCDGARGYCQQDPERRSGCGRASTRLAKIAAGIRRAMAQDRGSQGSSTRTAEAGSVQPVSSPWDPHDPEAGQ